MQDKEFAIVLEDIKSNFRAFKEGLDLLNTRFESFAVESRQTNQFLQNMLYEHEKWMQDHEVRIKTIEKKVA